jgi:hypothetical protein
MGIETAIIAASAASAIGNYNQAKSSARSTANQGRVAIENRKKEIQQLVAKQKIGYIQSGVELEGTAQAVIQDTYTTGQEDIRAMGNAYAKSISNQLSAARAQLLGSLAQTAVTAYTLKGITPEVGDAGSGALASGGSYMGKTAKGIDMYNLEGTAKTGGNVILYKPRPKVKKV